MPLILNPNASVKLKLKTVAHTGVIPIWVLFASDEGDQALVESRGPAKLAALLASPRFSTISEFDQKVGDDYVRKLALAQRITLTFKTSPEGVETAVMAPEVGNGILALAKRLDAIDKDLFIQGFATPPTMRYVWDSPVSARLVLTLTPIIRATSHECRQHWTAQIPLGGIGQELGPSWEGGDLRPIEIDSWDYLDRVGGK